MTLRSLYLTPSNQTTNFLNCTNFDIEDQCTRYELCMVLVIQNRKIIFGNKVYFFSQYNVLIMLELLHKICVKLDLPQHLWTKVLKCLTSLTPILLNPHKIELTLSKLHLWSPGADFFLLNNFRCQRERKNTV